MQSNGAPISGKYFLPAIVILGAYFIYRLIDQSKLLSIFPLDFHNDLSSYLAQLFFLDACGFHKFCPYWYNGFQTFNFSPPGWYFFTLPLYWVFGDVKVAAFVALLITFVMLFATIFYFGKYFGISRIKRIAFFLLLFANAHAIGNFIRLGRPHELLAWLFFIISTFIFIIYLHKDIDWKFFLAIPFIAATVLTYQSVGVFLFFVIAGALLSYHGQKNKFFVVLAAIIAIGLTLFWSLPFALHVNTDSDIASRPQGERLWSTSPKNTFTNVAAFLFPASLLLLFCIYWQNKRRALSYFLFFLPALLLSMLFLFKITPFFPVLRYIFPDPFLTYFLFFAAFFLVEIRLPRGKLRNLIIALILILPLASLMINALHTPDFVAHTKLDTELISLLPKIDDRYLMLGDFSKTDSYPRSYYAFAAIYYKKYTASGWYPQLASHAYMQKVDAVNIAFQEKNCSALKLKLSDINTPEVISINNDCAFFAACDFSYIMSTEHTCLVRTT